MKIKANNQDPYSILNPETNSDSPSAKSNGLRFVSAKQISIHNKNKNDIPKINLKYSCTFIILINPYDWLIKQIPIIIIAILTSYEITWANPRYDPISEYLEFEDQPLHKIVYPLILEIHKK